MELTPELVERLRRAFKKGNQFMLLMWRLGLGGYVNSWPEVGGRIMVLTHTGRKTGTQRRTPVNYILIDGDIYCTAGFGKVADWYRNILREPQVEVWLSDGWWQGIAEDASQLPNRIGLIRQVLIASGFAARTIGLNPNEMSDAQVAATSADYKLIRIRRTSACTGSGGPGDLAWIWPAAAFMLLPFALLKRRK